MPSGFKIYATLLFILIGAQLVLAGENMVDFQRELKAYQKDRIPSQSDSDEIKKTELTNPPIEISLQQEEEEQSKED